ncbi:MAG: cytochrome c biogenesis protein DipZ [Candidatus Dojkabacteria bacterium]
MQLLISSFLAGILTVLSPCVLPLLPVVIGSSLTSKSKSKPIIITLSLAVSIIVFTLLLKVSTLLINIPPELLQYISGGIVIFLGLINIFPKVWEEISFKLGFGAKSQQMLDKTGQKDGILGSILTGAALGPVFSSCSPTYAIIVATVLPASFADGFVNLLAYAAGLSLLMFLIAIFGRNLIQRIKFLSNPDGWFRKGLGILFVLVGLAVVTGFDKKVQTFMVDNHIFNATQFEANITGASSSTELFNIKKPYAAPEFAGINDWINSNPLKISELKGKVVLIDFWTYSCINCIRTLPVLTGWDTKYRDDGLVIVGVHSPEFQFEKVKSNVEKAVSEYGIKYPVAQDNDFRTWRAYNNQYWPGEYFIDRDGKVRHFHAGEGMYEQNENIIRALLKEGGHNLTDPGPNGKIDVPITQGQTPETYLGFSRGDVYSNPNVKFNYTLKSDLVEDEWSLGGEWTVSNEFITSEADNTKLNLKFSAKEVYLVMGADSDKKVSVMVNGKKVTIQDMGGIDVNENGNVIVNEYKLYKIVDLKEFKSEQMLELTFEKGVKANAFTFGS